MAPRKNDRPVVATRRSGRIASRAGSVVSSTQEENKSDAVISAFADREEHFKKRADDADRRANELETELARLLAETERMKKKTKTPMRDGMFQQSLKKRREQTPASTNTPSISRTITSSTFQSPIVTSETTNDSIDFSTANLITGTPAPVRESQTQHREDNATPGSRTSIFGSFFKTITTPFFSRSKSQEGNTPQQSPQESLGELPASRKRAAPAQTEPNTYTRSRPQVQAQAQQMSTPAPQLRPEPERQTGVRSTPRVPSTLSVQKTARTFTVPSSKNPLQETSLATITEHTETGEQSINGATTPSRAPRSIAAVRRAQQTPSRMSLTPTRAWSQQPPPRDTNADRRLSKLRQFQELTNQLRALKEDEEVQQITERPLKRVKIDTLVKIPARRPGESSGTFRMFDVDSDDEMEVDADEAVRSNIFELSTTEDAPVDATPKTAASTSTVERRASAPTPAVAAPAPVSATVPAVPAAIPVAAAAETTVPDVPAKTFEFPSVGALPEGKNDINNAYLCAKFAYGYEHWMATGESLPLF